MENLEKLWPIVATLLTAALGAAGVLLQEWRQKRDDRHQRKQVRDEASEMVSFIEKWIQTQQLTCLPEEFEQVKQMAHQQLERIYYSLLNMQEVKKQVEERSFIQRALLLYKPASFSGWVLHLVFYMLGLMIMLWGVISALFFLDSSAAQSDNNDPSRGVLILTLVIFYLLLFVPALAIRAWATIVDKKNAKQQTDGASVVPAIHPNDDVPFMIAYSDEVEYLKPVATQFRDRVLSWFY